MILHTFYSFFLMLIPSTIFLQYFYNISTLFVILFQALVKGSHELIVPYVSLILGSLMQLLHDPSSTVVGAALSTIGG